MLLCLLPAMHAAANHGGPARKELRPLRSVLDLPCRIRRAFPARSWPCIQKTWWNPGAGVDRLGLQRALVVHGKDGLDEISISGPTKIGEYEHGMEVA